MVSEGIFLDPFSGLLFPLCLPLTAPPPHTHMQSKSKLDLRNVHQDSSDVRKCPLISGALIMKAALSPLILAACLRAALSLCPFYRCL